MSCCCQPLSPLSVLMIVWKFAEGQRSRAATLLAKSHSRFSEHWTEDAASSNSLQRYRDNTSGFDVQLCSARYWLCIPFLESCTFIFLIYLLFLTFPLTFSISEDFFFWSTGKCQRGLLRWDWAARSAGGSVWSVFGFEVECRMVNSNQDTDCYCSTEKELNGWLIWSLANQSVDLLTTSAPPIMFSICNLEVKTVDGYLCSQCWVCLMVSWLDKLGIVCVCVRKSETKNEEREIRECGVKEINYIIFVCDYPDLQSVFVFLLFICFSIENKGTGSLLISL